MGVKVIATLQYGVGIIWLYALNHTGSPVGDMTQVPAVYAIIGTAILALVALLSVFAVYDLMRCLVLEQKIKAAWFPLAVSCYLLLILTQNLITQYHLAFSSAAAQYFIYGGGACMDCVRICAAVCAFAAVWISAFHFSCGKIVLD